MSTNYYFRLKKEKRDQLDTLFNIIFNKNFKIIYNEEIIAILNKEIHIGKTSYGWRPLFQKTDYFNSLKELILFYNLNKNDFDIVDEYNRIISWEEFEKEMIINKSGNFSKDYNYYFDNDNCWFNKREFF